MNSVNDLNRTSDIINGPQTQQPISLSALKDEETTSSVSINSVGGLTGVEEQYVNNRPVVRINPTHRGFERRTISNPDELHEVNPSDIIPKQKAVQGETPRDRALGLLDEAVNRKRQEYHDFIEHAKEEDAINRENVENGLDRVNGEVEYMPEDLQEDKNNKVVENNSSETKDYDEIVVADDDNLYYSFDDADTISAPERVSNVSINNPFDEDDAYENEVDDSSNSPVEEIDIEEESVDNEIVSNDVVKEETTDIVEEKIVEEEEKFDISENAITVTNDALNSKVDANSSDFDIDESDFEDVTNDSEEQLTDEQIMEIAEASEKHLRNEILQKVVKTGKKLNTSQFKVSNKVINVKDALRKSSPAVERTASWPLTFAGRPYIASALKGPEIALMSDSDNSDEGSSLSMTQARIMFEHDANPYRPATLEAWAKTIPFADIDNIFAALYVASIKGANYIPMACPKDSCQYAYLHDEIDINDMVKFDTDESKKNFEKIKAMKLTAENTGSYESVVSVINDDFAVGLKLPSIFTILYEYNSLNREFINKYTAMVSIVQYIDFMYHIDPETNSLEPIGWKTYPGDNTKTFKSKIATYAKILKEFDDTEFSILMALINSMVAKASDNLNISFEIPAAKCPKCGATIEARPFNARGMVFMRQRLVELATTPTAK